MIRALVEVPLSISTPASCDGVPASSELRTMILSPMLTVFEFTVVVVPFTVKSPSTIKLSSNVLSPSIVEPLITPNEFK
jgi:hypothetical protein